MIINILKAALEKNALVHQAYSVIVWPMLSVISMLTLARRVTKSSNSSLSLATVQLILVVTCNLSIWVGEAGGLTFEAIEGRGCNLVAGLLAMHEGPGSSFQYLFSQACFMRNQLCALVILGSLGALANAQRGKKAVWHLSSLHVFLLSYHIIVERVFLLLFF